jgi:F0F1-type ATP synthase alpha subunit
MVIDDLPVANVKKILYKFISYLATSKKSYIETVTATYQFTEEAETLLQEAIAESKVIFAKINELLSFKFYS